MKTFLLIAVAAFSSYSISAQTTTKKNRSSSKSATYKKGAALPAATTSTTPAIDSFKRSNRYSPGKPYEAANTNAANANNTTTTTTNDKANQGGTNNTAGSNTVINNRNTQVNSGTNTMNSNGSIPVSPSNEPNRADVNQRQLNENSKNAISDISSGQVNALNQNQMAPPPQNWGNNQPVDNKWGRNTVGESQWTPNTTISSGFNRDFPNVSGATWIRDVRDTLNYSARYRTGDYWTISTYNTAGMQIDTRTELPLTDLPRPVALYGDKQRANKIQLERVTRVERPSKPWLYEVRLNTGRLVYIDSNGVEVPW